MNKKKITEYENFKYVLINIIGCIAMIFWYLTMYHLRFDYGRLHPIEVYIPIVINIWLFCVGVDQFFDSGMPVIVLSILALLISIVSPGFRGSILWSMYFPLILAFGPPFASTMFISFFSCVAIIAIYSQLKMCKSETFEITGYREMLAVFTILLTIFILFIAISLLVWIYI